MSQDWHICVGLPPSLQRPILYILTLSLRPGCVQFLVDTLALGPVAPFDAAAVVMVIGGVVVLLTWPENFGDASNRHTLGEQLRNAAMAIYSGATLALGYQSQAAALCGCAISVVQPSPKELQIPQEPVMLGQKGACRRVLLHKAALGGIQASRQASPHAWAQRHYNTAAHATIMQSKTGR